MKYTGNCSHQRFGFIRLLLATLVLLFACPAITAGEKEADCKLIGSWLGYNQAGLAWWMSTADGQNASQGTLNLEVPGSVLFFPDAVAVTEMRGVWKKTGANTFDWTVVAFPYDESTNTLLLAKLSGKDRISYDCDTLYVTDVVMELFFPFDNPNTAAPFMSDSFPDHEGIRIKIDVP